MEAVITKEVALRVFLHGACSAPTVGAKISSFPTSSLVWVEDRKCFTANEIKKISGNNLPAWVLSGDGDGDGYGYGYGDGDGYGDGNGNGNGNGRHA